MLRDASRASAVVVLLVALTGCAGIGQPAPYDSTGINGLDIPTPTPDASDFVTGVDNPWLPLEPGSTWGYDLMDGGSYVGALHMRVLDGTTDIAGLRATAVEISRRIGGRQGSAIRYYVQDVDGNVWWVGEDDGADEWRAGVDGAEAGLAMPARPRLGDGWLAYRVPGRPEGSTTVEDQSRDMVQMREVGQAETDTSMLKTYRSGVGLVTIEDVDSGVKALLVGHTAG